MENNDEKLQSLEKLTLDEKISLYNDYVTNRFNEGVFSGVKKYLFNSIFYIEDFDEVIVNFTPEESYSIGKNSTIDRDTKYFYITEEPAFVSCEPYEIEHFFNDVYENILNYLEEN